MMPLSYKKWLGLWKAVHTLLFVAFCRTHTICHFSFLLVLQCPAGFDLFSLSGLSNSVCMAWISSFCVCSQTFLFLWGRYFAVKSLLVLRHWITISAVALTAHDHLKPEIWRTVMSCWKKFSVFQKVKTSQQKVKTKHFRDWRNEGPCNKRDSH